MVTKEELVEYLRNMYDLQNDNGSLFSFFVELDDNQRQECIIDIDEGFCRILSPVGGICESKLNDALDLLFKKYIGGLVKGGEDYYVNHTFILDGIDSPVNVSIIVYFVSKFAHNIKEEILGTD